MKSSPSVDVIVTRKSTRVVTPIPAMASIFWNSTTAIRYGDRKRSTIVFTIPNEQIHSSPTREHFSLSLLFIRLFILSLSFFPFYLCSSAIVISIPRPLLATEKEFNIHILRDTLRCSFLWNSMFQNIHRFLLAFRFVLMLVISKVMKKFMGNTDRTRTVDALLHMSINVKTLWQIIWEKPFETSIRRRRRRVSYEVVPELIVEQVDG